LQPSFPPEIRDLDSNQRYLTAYTAGLSLVGLISLAFYKFRSYFS
jgi:hypothetical protein